MNPIQSIKYMNPIQSIKYMNTIQIKYMNPNQTYESNPNQIYESKSNESITESFNSFYISHLLLCISFYYYLFIFMIHPNVARHIITLHYTYEWICITLLWLCVPCAFWFVVCVSVCFRWVHICMRKSNPTKNPGSVIDKKCAATWTHHPNSNFFFAKCAELNGQS